MWEGLKQQLDPTITAIAAILIIGITIVMIIANGKDIFYRKPKAIKEEILDCWKNYSGRAQELSLPSAPKQFLHYFSEDNLPQTKLQRNLEGGMAISIGRLREDSQYDYKFVCLSHNTLRGAAGGGVLLAELLCAEGYID